MRPRKPRTFRRRLGSAFRWLPIFVWLVLLAALCTLIYLDRVGLPDFAKRRVLDELRSRGLEMEFAKLRLRWFRGIVGERVSLVRADKPEDIQATIEEVTLGIDWSALRRREFRIDSVALHEARVVWPIPLSNAPPRQIVVEHVHGNLAFEPGDLWKLTQLQAQSFGSKLLISGVLTNASRLGERIAQARATPATRKTESQIHQLLDTFEKIEFSSPPDLQITIRGDAEPHQEILAELRLRADGARSPFVEWKNLTAFGEVQRVPGSENQINASLVIKADDARGPDLGRIEMARVNLQYNGSLTNLADFKSHLQFSLMNATNRWGRGRNWQINGDLQRLGPGTNLAFGGELHAVVDDFKTEWASASQVNLHAQIPAYTNQNSFRAAWTLGLKNVASRWGVAESLQLNGDTAPAPLTNLLQSAVSIKGTRLDTKWVKAPEFQASAQATHPATNSLQPEAATFQTSFQQPRTPWGTAESGLLSGRVAHRAPAARTATRDWGLWADLEPFSIEWDWLFHDLRSTNFVVEKIACGGLWNAPEVAINNLKADLFGGTLTATGRLDVATRELRGAADSSFELRALAPLLRTNEQVWLRELKWETPPQLRFSASAILPPWTTNSPAATNLLASLQGEAALALGRGNVRGIDFKSIAANATLTNLLLTLPAFAVTRDEGSVTGRLATRIDTLDFSGNASSTINPLALVPVLGRGARDFLKFAAIPSPPAVAGFFQGNWTNLDNTTASARGSIGNFSYRAEAFTAGSAAIVVTNHTLHLFDARLARDERYGTAGLIALNFDTQRLYLSNIFSILPPMAVTRMIGPQTAKAVEPYRFIDPPTIRLNGSLDVRESETTDMHFEIITERFNWSKFNVARSTSSVHWVTNTLLITNINAEFYRGSLVGNAFFDFEARPGTPFHFTLFGTNFDLHLLMADLTHPTNQFEGSTTVNLHITSANTDDWKSWNGFGHAYLRDGLIWQAPIFGIFSPVLNSISPGLGTSRAREAAGNFTITNSVIHTKDLEIRSPPVRLHYDGTVDFDMRIAARVEAEMFRDMPLVGRLVSLALMPFTKVFEYKVTGTLADPKSEPLFLAKLILFPLRPFKTIKELFQRNDPPAPPNTVPKPEK